MSIQKRRERSEESDSSEKDFFIGSGERKFMGGSSVKDVS